MIQKLSDRAIKVESFSPSQMRKYRQVGVKNGAKNFSLPTPRGNSVSKSKKNSEQEKGEGGLSLEKLQAKVDTKALEKDFDERLQKRDIKAREEKKMVKDTPQFLKKEIKAAESGVPLTALQSSTATENFRRQESMRRNMLSQMGTNSDRAEILKRTGFNLHFEPPEGITEDELNSVEKIFYSFQKRTFVTYVNSFVSTYQDKLLNRPQLATALRNERHLLTGKIDFDREGNILRLKILRSSPNDDVHELFEETLRGIRTLPNPPKAMIEGKEIFTIYYQLNINY